MKIDNGETNKKLGIIVVGLFLGNLGYFMNILIKDTSLTFFNGLKDGLCVGLEIVGVALFAYGLVGLIKHNKNK